MGKKKFYYVTLIYSIYNTFTDAIGVLLSIGPIVTFQLTKKIGQIKKEMQE